MMKLSTSLMIPLTRLFGSLNSPVPRRFVTSSAIVPLRKTLTFTPGIRLSSPQFAKAASFATKLGPDPLTFTRPAGEQYVVVGYPGQGGENVNSEQRRALPEELAKRLRILTCDSTAEGAEGGQCTVYLIGTIHGFEKSRREVQKVVSHLKPEVVFLESCSTRAKNWKAPSMERVLMKEKHGWFRILFRGFCARYREALGIYPVSEFDVAFAEATKYGGKVILGDRPIEITKERCLGGLKLYHKAILCISIPIVFPIALSLRICWPEYFMKKKEKFYDKYDADDWCKRSPSMKLFGLHKAAVVERDQYLAFTLWRVAGRHRSVVAVVGMGHLRGIKSHWKQHVNINELLEVFCQSQNQNQNQNPNPNPIVSAIQLLAVAAFMYNIILPLYERRKSPTSIQEDDLVDQTTL